LLYDQALIALNQMDQFDRRIRQIFFYVRFIVGSIFGIQKVGAGQMAYTAFDGHETTHTSNMA